MLECTKCKIQNVGRAETEFRIRLNNNRKDAWKSHAIFTSRHFSDKNHNFNTHAKFILIEQTHQININKEENLGKTKTKIKLLETLRPKSLKQEHN